MTACLHTHILPIQPSTGQGLFASSLSRICERYRVTPSITRIIFLIPLLQFQRIYIYIGVLSNSRYVTDELSTRLSSTNALAMVGAIHI